MPGSNGNGHNQRLDSWKEIAAYLRRDERTAIRWQDRGLPVHRVPGGKRAAVFAFTAELEAWLTQEEPQGLKPAPINTLDGTAGSRALLDTAIQDGSVEGRTFPTTLLEAASTTRNENGWQEQLRSGTLSSPANFSSPTAVHPRRTLLLSAIGLVLLTIGIGVTVSNRRVLAVSPVIPVRVGFNLNSVETFDNENRLLWTHTFPQNLDTEALFQYRALSERARIADFRGDGKREVLVPVPYPDVTTDTARSEVDLFSSQGNLLWAFVPKFSFQFGKHTVAGFWVVQDLLVSPLDHQNTIWTTFQDGEWGNSFVANLDPASGNGTLRFVNTGSIHVLGEVRTDRTFLVVGAFNNEADLGSLAITDEARAFAASPQTRGSRHECVSCPAGAPDYYFEFPRSELNELKQIHDDGITNLVIMGPQVEAIKGGVRKEDKALVHYIIRADRAFGSVALRFNSNYDTEHRKYEREGSLHHALENCPERLHPRPVRMWTPGGGWTEIQIEPTPYNQ